MSCRGRCSTVGNLSAPARTLNTSGGNAPAPSHRTVHISMERSPTRPEPMAGSYAEYAGYGNIRIPPAARASTPGPYGYPSQYEAFGSQIDYNLNWMPKDINLSELLDQTSGQIPSRFRRMEQNIAHAPPTLPPPTLDPAPATNANPLLPKEQSRDESSPKAQKIQKEREESLIEWFDRSVEKELKKHKASTLGKDLQFVAPVTPDQLIPDLGLSKGVLQKVSEATASQMEICFDLRQDPDTDLTSAVERLAKAEAMCAFAEAVKAAEAAAEAAPPELAEEAALASARGFQTDLKASGVHGEIQGTRPIEVLGYVGVTKPKYPTKRQ